jgi:hypothetical protein
LNGLIERFVGSNHGSQHFRRRSHRRIQTRLMQESEVAHSSIASSGAVKALPHIA